MMGAKYLLNSYPKVKLSWSISSNLVLAYWAQAKLKNMTIRAMVKETASVMQSIMIWMNTLSPLKILRYLRRQNQEISVRKAKQEESFSMGT